MDGFLGTAVLVIGIGAFVAAIVAVGFFQSRKSLRESKNYERGLKMIPLLIHLPPSSDDIEGGQRDARDVTEEVISQAQVMYNVISSTATKGFKSKFYGQRHIAFEMVASKGLIHYYVVVPMVLLDSIQQAVVAAYPTARLEEVEENNLFSEVGKISGTIGGEFTLKKDYSIPIATYQESKRDAMRAILSALSSATREDGVGVQLLLRPAPEGWTKSVEKAADDIRKGRKSNIGGFGGGNLGKTINDLMEALWKAPEAGPQKEASEQKQLTGLDQANIEALEDKARYAGYEVLIRIVASSSTAARSQSLLQNIISAFALFDSPTKNGFKFLPTKSIEQFVTSYIFRFFPPEIRSNILNTVELATIFHLPDQSNIPTSQLKRQQAKQVDGPTEVMDEGLLIGYNVFRGVKKPIRISEDDRRRHTYIIGQTGMGKSVLLENLALQDMLDGKGFAFIDPHGDSAESLLAMVPKERVEDVIYFNPGDMTSPIGLNMFEFDSPDQKDFLIQEIINMLYSLYDPGHTGIVGPRLEHIFRNCALLLMSDPNGGTFIDVPKVLVDPDFMKSKLQYVTDQTVLDYWTKEFPAAQRSNESGEVTSWVVSKWGPFLSNDMMRNILGQLKSGFNLREIMDGKKILLVNLSKGKMGELNSKLLGMIFVMKFQAAAMSRANVPADQREDFCLFVDEFQNFATESFESILSEARKFKLNLIVANQFMTQLTDKIREAIIGNVGAVICGRIGVTDAELMVKRFQPTFDVSDLQHIPNHEAVAQMLIKGVPTSPFSMSLIPPMGHANPQLADALRRLSAAKYGRDRQTVEQEIFKRLRAADEAKETEKQKRLEAMRNSSVPAGRPVGGGAMSSSAAGGPIKPVQNSASKPSSSSSSFLDEWLAKRQRAKSQPSLPTKPASLPTSSSTPVQSLQAAPTEQPTNSQAKTTSEAEIAHKISQAKSQAQTKSDEKEAVKRAEELSMADDGIDEISIDLRGNLSYKSEDK